MSEGTGLIVEWADWATIGQADRDERELCN